MTPDSWLRNDGMSIYEIARVMRVSPARIRQIEMQALAKLRRCPGALRQFLGINDHLGDDTYESALSCGGRSTRGYLNTPATPRPKEGASR